MDKNQILFTEIEKRIKDITAEMDFYYKKIDKLDAICEELERLLSIAESDGEDDEYIEKLEFDECFEEDDEELSGLKKDYSEVCSSFDEFKKQFNSMLNRNKVFCDCCGEEMTQDTSVDGYKYYYCEECGYEYCPHEEIDEDDCTPDLFRDEPVDPCDDCDDCDCDDCEFNDEDDSCEEDFEDCTITCRKCCGDMFEEIDEEGDRYYECSNCGRVEYM